MIEQLIKNKLIQRSENSIFVYLRCTTCFNQQVALSKCQWGYKKGTVMSRNVTISRAESHAMEHMELED